MQSDSGAAAFPGDVRGVHFHLVGVKGTGMAALAEILCARGALVTGSDVPERFYTDEVLERLGISALPFSAGNVGGDVRLVVRSSAYSAATNPDLAEAERRGVPTMLYSEALGALSASCFAAGVCGVHGKTTTAGLCGTVLAELGLPFQALAGSVIASFGNSCTISRIPVGADSVRYFVAETCEYQRHFMAFHPKAIVLTSVESDHQDFYPTYEDIRAAFVDYALLLPEGGTLVYCADDAGASEVAGIVSGRRGDVRLVPYGERADGGFRLEMRGVSGGEMRFMIPAVGECALRVPGAHNARNACGAVALCSALLRDAGRDVSGCADAVRRGLLSFTGGRRRSEVVGRARTPLGEDVVVIDDYGHHPTAIRTTLAGYRDFYRGRRIVVDFMSHTYSRTAALLDEFASSFGSADDVFVNEIYGSAREDATAAAVSGRLLAERTAAVHPRAEFAPDFGGAAGRILSLLSGPSGAEGGWLVVTMGAGDNWKVGREVLAALAS